MSPPAWTASVLGRARSPMAWFQLVAGLWLFAAGVVLGLRSRLGVGPWDVLHDGIRHVTPLSFGVATILVGVVLRVGVVRAIIETSVLIIGVLLGGAAGIGTILFAFGIGPAVEVAFRLLGVEVPSKKTAPRVQPCETC